MTTRSSTNPAAALQLVEVKPGLQFPVTVLRQILPDVETALFFGKVYDLNYIELSALIQLLFRSSFVDVLFRGDHSTELQDYLVDIHEQMPPAQQGEINYSPDVPHAEILPEVWKQLEVEVADSIKAVAAKLGSVISKMPSKQGQMTFQAMMKLNAKRPTIGDYRATIQHQTMAQNLVIMDVSGSMTSSTVHAIVNEVVALSYEVDAHMAIVSNSLTYWEPGSYGVDEILAAAEFGGTRYEKLAPLFDGSIDWGTVISIADYDSSQSAKEYLQHHNKSKVGQLLDISLVNRTTFMAECLAHMADEVRPILIGNSYYVLS